MKCAAFRFYAELNDFLPTARRQISFDHPFDGRLSIKDSIEALGIPHTEIDLILVNGQSVDFSYQLQDGDRISVYPVFESMDITPLVRVRPHPLRETRFVLDVHLGRLAAYLRLAGFDTVYRNDYQDAELAAIAVRERRILLTRDQGLLKRNSVTHGYWVRETAPRLQLLEVLRKFDLFGNADPFARCLRCNDRLRPVSKEEVVDRLPPRTRQLYEEFHFCDQCNRIYWKGSHYLKMEQFLKETLREDRLGDFQAKDDH